MEVLGKAWASASVLALAAFTACLEVPELTDTDDGTAGPGTDSSTSNATMSGSSQGPGSATTASSTTSPTTTGSTGGGDPVEFVDDESGFAAGTFDSTLVSEGAVRLDVDQATGTFTSRVFDAGAEARWNAVAWMPAGPYDKPLPHDGNTESGYVDNDLDSANELIALFPFDEGPFSAGDIAVDRSGRGNDGTVFGSVSVFAPAGVFAEAAEFTSANYVSIPIGPDSDFQFGTSDFTWSMWANTVSSCAGTGSSSNQVFMGAEDSSNGATHMWFGCLRPQAGVCPAGDMFGGRAGGTFNTSQGTGEDTGLCGTTDIVDGQWHHLVVVKREHDPANMQLYVDGELEFERSADLTNDYTFVDGQDYTFGAFSGGTFQANTTLDEIAIWKRALTSDEVGDLYRRGALSLTLSVRTCSEPDCADDPPFSAGVIDPPDALAAGSAVELATPLTGRYVQYRATLAGVPTLSQDQSPRLFGVTVSGLL